MVRFHMAISSPVSIICLLVGAAIGAAQGCFVAYLQDPGLHRHAGRHAGVPRALPLACWQGQSVGPFPPSFQQLSTGFMPDFLIPPLGEIFAAVDPAFATLHLTSLLIGLVVTALLIYANVRDRAQPGEARPWPRSRCRSSSAATC